LIHSSFGENLTTIMDTLHGAKSVFFHTLCHLLNIYRSENCFNQKLCREMEQHYYNQCSFSISLTGCETIQQKGKDVPEILWCVYEAYPQNKFVCKYAAATLQSIWCACVQSLLVLLEGTDVICGQLNCVYALSCVFTMFKKIEKPATCEMCGLCFLNARNMKPADIDRQLCEAYGEHAMSDSVVRRWMRHLNEGRENVHDDPRPIVCG
jgi:hypothetical protein